MNHTTNGNNKGILWVAGAILGPICLATFGMMLNITINSAQRIATLEAEFKEVRRGMDTIDAKLDRLLEARR
jgi:hypothetical protein